MNSAAYLFALCAIFFGFEANATSADCQQHRCIAVVDGGSTGSRLHIYAYDLDQTQTPINLRELWSKKVRPGLSTIVNNQATVNTYLGSLFSDAPADNLPVYFYATAGMRLLSQPQQKQVYNLVQNWFAGQPQWHLKNAKTITGTEEGMFGWLAVNYQLGTLNSPNKSAVGVMDMGGASVQIIFPVDRAEGLNESDLMQVDLYGRHTKLFVHSFLGLGQTEVTHQYLDSSSCFANDYELPTGRTATGDAYTCEKEVSSLMNDVHRVNQIVQPAIKVNPVDDWYVLGGMAELVQSQPFQFEGRRFTNESLLEQANSLVCQQQWPTLSSQYSDNEFFYGYCLFPSYYYALMVDGYGIQPGKAIHYMTASQGGDWTMGVVLNQRISS
ncbi:Golgi nucleoside diphosphatase [Legionella massiliensis]|uniref:Golgi nucleoside diphosphatase n=1 Tax=Legionella massiliensis TaxID=1034943 RepID=A0A078L4W1_9GAMM|nr:multidrug DMT transporter permease [Legionella massiliensis]CDZ78938.1 Golgi nucleoside diphosphatase [Legionella massiliensis]CEE14676.1 GDA1/CD39 (nucleoside phosphatase) family protein [Legionella massiliensis]